MKQKSNSLESALAAMEANILLEMSGLRESLTVERMPDELDVQMEMDARDHNTMRLIGNSRRLQEVRAARQRLRDGSFGHCESCGERIPPKRLQAVPYAPCCVSCQELRDQEVIRPGSEYQHRMVQVG